jgi:2-polyprenyl-3-methyl-5-hydroxy-6-metoxy-1,4-benzoquinol methylase
MEQKLSVFDKTAADFAASVDGHIQSGRYQRGRLFLAAAKSSLSPGSYILDYGCGPGRISALLARSGFRVLGVDPSSAMIDVARSQPLQALRVSFDTCASSPIDDRPAAFDAVVCSSVIEYEPDPVQLLKRFSAALRPSGFLIISFANSRSISRAIFQRRNLHLDAQKNTWTWSQFRELLQRGGFKPIQDTVYFESALDRVSFLRFLSASQFTGALGLVVAVKNGPPPAEG